MFKIKQLKNDKILEFIGILSRFKSKNIVLTLSLMVFTSLTEGISLLLLVPLLQLVGMDVQQGSLGQIAGYISSFFSYVGIEPTLTVVLVIYAFIISLSALIYRFQTTETAIIQYEFAANLRKHLFKRLSYSNWIFFTKNRSSDFAHALTNEIERISGGTGLFLTLISNILVLSVYIIFALKLSGIITGLVLIVGITLLILLKKRTHSAGASGEKLSDTTKNMYSSAIQHLDGMKTVKSFNMEDKNVQEFSGVVDNVVNSYMGAVKSYADVKMLFDIGSVIILSLIVFILITSVNVSTAELLILLFLFVRVIPLFSSIQRNYQYFINMLPAFTSVMNLEKECIKAEELQTGTEKIEFLKEIQFKNTSFHYNLEHNAFSMEKLNLIIEAGKTTAIAGLSGAGKSTVADLVMGLLKPDEGHILIDGVSLTAKNALNWRNHIGYVAQETFLFNDTVKNNLSFAEHEADDNDMWNALKLASADKFVSNLPEGLNTLIGDRGVLLSGGERQRLALARALLCRPSLLILDEATSNLDSKNEKKILDSIDKLHGNITILVIAHRLSTIKNADRIYFIEKGELVESGSWDELIKIENGYFEALYEVQS